jgi:hypothetical protein
MSSYAKSFAGGFCILALMGAGWAKEHPHVADADREYAAVFSHVKNPCTESTTLGYEQCTGKEVEFTEKHMKAFLAAVRGILADEDGPSAGPDGGSGASSAKGVCEYRTDRQYVKQVADAISLKILAK